MIAGQDEMLERVLVCLVAGGHLLIEGVPGLAKTLTIKTTAAVLGGTFRRVQFTPDLVPSDLVGTRIYRPDTGGFDTEEGPVFCNFLLADEINRAPAKVQSALLEVMQERQVTIGHDTHLVPDPFLVMATQNPIESEGTYPLPEAQVDRFMLKVVVGYPSRDEELTVVQRSLVAPPTSVRCSSSTSLKALAARRAGRLRRPLADRVRGLSRRGDAQPGLGRAARDRRLYRVRGEPAGPIALVQSARALALVHGRDYVLGTDVRSLAKDALRHRLVLTYRALAEQRTADDVLDAVLRPSRRRRSSSGGRSQREHDCRAFGVVETPERPGPGPMPEPLLRALELSIGRRVDGLLAGDHRSHLLGRGSELAQIRPYVPGDDVRLIDWNVTARTRETHVRVQLAERVLVTWVVLDRTPSMGFGTADRRKADVALGVTLALGHAASSRGNRVGLVSFGAGPEEPLPPRQGRAGLVGMLLTLGEQGEGRRGRPRAGAHGRSALSPANGHSSPSSRISEGRVTGARPLVDLAARHDVLAVEIRDPREDELVDVGEVWFSDPETGARLRVDTAMRGCAPGSPKPPSRSAGRSLSISGRRVRRTSSSRRVATGCVSSPPTSGRRR